MTWDEIAEYTISYALVVLSLRFTSFTTWEIRFGNTTTTATEKCMKQDISQMNEIEIASRMPAVSLARTLRAVDGIRVNGFNY